jgi:hypothetical protein
MIFAVLLGGCTNMNIHQRSNESIRDEMLEHLSQKYGKQFTAISLERGHSDTLTCFSTGGDPIADIVRVRRTENNGTVELADTFFGVLIREELEAEVTKLLSGIAVPLRVIYPSDIAYFNNSFDATKNFADFMSWSSSGNNLWGFDICVILSLDKLDDAEIYANQVFDRISGSNFHGLIHAIVLPSEGFAKLTRANINDLVSEYDGRTTTISKNVS